MTKTALITGAAGGIGKSLCAEFTKAGYRVIATDRVFDRNAECGEFIECDLEKICHSADQLTKFIDGVRDSLNGEGLNVLVNNAALQILGETKDITVNDWMLTFDVNVTAPFLLAQALTEDLAVAGGSIVNIASVHSRATKPGFVSYATSKAALVGLTQALAVDLGGKVRVNVINPAATETTMLLASFEGKMDLFNELEKMHPINRIAKPEEVSQVALFLASTQASFITGTAIDVDGGILSRLHDPD